MRNVHTCRLVPLVLFALSLPVGISAQSIDADQSRGGMRSLRESVVVNQPTPRKSAALERRGGW